MPTLDVFKASAFDLRSMTDAINFLPFVPGRLGEMGIFQESGIATTVAQIEERDGVLYLVPSAPRGGPATQNRATGRRVRPLSVVHLPLEDRIMADEVQGIRAFGSENDVETIQGVVSERTATAVQSFEATFEHMRVGAIKGSVLDADGVTELYDLFTLFGVTAQTPVDFDLLNGSPVLGDIRKVCSTIIRTIEDSLGAVPYTSISGICGKNFFDDLVDHVECRDAYSRYLNGNQFARVARRTFFYGGIDFEEYRGKVGSVQYIADDECRFFPVGTPGLFRMVFAPANFIETVNTIGLPFYSRQMVDPGSRWVDILMQSNPLPYCTRPRVLIQGNRTTS